MPTESLLVKFSAKRAWKTPVSADSTSVVHDLKTVLLAADWTLDSSPSAVSVITFPLSVPVVDGDTVLPKRVVGCGTPIVSVLGVGYVVYDPGRSVPVSPAACIFVPAGITGAITIDNLAVAITLNSLFNATWTTRTPTGFILTLSSKIGGPDLNFSDISADGRLATTTVPVGGGYTCTCYLSDSIYTVYFYGDLLGFGTGTYFKFTFPTGTATYNLDTTGVSGFTIIANPHMFTVFDPQNTSEAGVSASIMAAAPFRTCSAAYIAFVIGPRQLQHATFYNGTHTISFDGTQSTFTGTTGCIKLLCFRSAGIVPLTTPNGKAILTSAYISGGKNSSDTGAILGILYDCIMSSDQVTSPDLSVNPSLISSGSTFVEISSQSGAGGGTRSSLLMSVPKKMVASPKTGTVNLFGAGVTRLSGNTFDFSDVAKVITIGGLSGTISSVTDGDHLTLVATLGILAGATYNIG